MSNNKVDQFTEVIRKFLLFLSNPLYIFFCIKGILPYRWKRVSKVFMTDLLNNRNTSLKQKIWAYKRGFTSDCIHRWGLNESNYSIFMPIFDFYKTKSYVNRRVSRWFDDKLTTVFILSSYREYLPVYYYSVLNGKVRQLYGITGGIENSIDAVLKTLREKRELALKKTWGSGGKGFWRISFCEGEYFVNKDPIKKTNLTEFILNSGDLLISEYLHAHPELKKIYSVTPNSVRILTIYDENDGPQITGACIKFGTSESGFVDNLASGGVLAGINLDDGTYFKPIRKFNKQIVPCLYHPDTKVEIKGVLPNWRQITLKLLEISSYLNIAPYLGFDIVATSNSFKIIEINSHGSPDTQIWHPFFENKYQRKLFGYD